jgi:hypothetical protein
METVVRLKKIKDTKNFRKYAVFEESKEVFSTAIMRSEIYVQLTLGQALGEECELALRSKSA